MATKITNSGIVFNDSTSQITQGIEFVSGTLMLFQQSAAPVGWSKQTVHNNKALRVVSGSASSGGTLGFTSVFSSNLVSGPTTLSTAQIPSHSHTIWTPIGGSDGQPGFGNIGSNNNGQTGFTGGSSAHTHTLASFEVAYVDLIIAAKN